MQDVFVRKCDRSDVCDAEVNPRYFISCGVVGFELDFTDEV